MEIYPQKLVLDLTKLSVVDGICRIVGPIFLSVAGDDEPRWEDKVDEGDQNDGYFPAVIRILDKAGVGFEYDDQIVYPGKRYLLTVATKDRFVITVEEIKPKVTPGKAAEILDVLIQEFPGLEDGETAVNGADLVAVSRRLPH